LAIDYKLWATHQTKLRMLRLDFTMVLSTTSDKAKRVMPNAAAVWVDPFWTGVWHVVDETNVFRVRGVLTPLQPSWASQQSVSSASCCDSVKVHFFRLSKDNNDFMYSSAFPLKQGPTSTYGVFNYNDSDGQSCERDSSIRMIVANHTLPSSLMLLSPKGPDAAHHNRTIEVGNWIDVAFSEMWPKNRTCMTNPRTYFRDYCCTLFFTDICKLFDKAGRSNLPPWLACYSLANALIVNGVPPHTFLDMPIDREFLRIIKCVITPWTMCAREGLFWDDKSLGKPTEDQPFPLSFVPTYKERVFGRDDCEGRASQAQEIVELLVNIFQYVKARGEKEALARLGPCDKLQMSPKKLLALLQGCSRIGELLSNKTIESQTIVGEADTAAIHGGTGSVVGHSFGLLRSGSRNYMTVENTGWQRPHLACDGKIRRANAFRIRDMMMAGSVSDAIENKLYHRLYMGHDKLFFSKSNKELSYGATLTDIAEGRCECMTLQQVLQALCEGQRPRIWPARAGAEQMLKKYAQIQASLPGIRQTLMTPQKSEAEFEHLMQAWGVIQEKDLPVCYRPGGLWFKTDTDAWDAHVQDDLETVPITTHAFMHSIVGRIG